MYKVNHIPFKPKSSETEPDDPWNLLTFAKFNNKKQVVFRGGEETHNFMYKHTCIPHLR